MSNHDLIQRNETNQNSKGGTELLQDRLYDGLVPRELLEQFQIVFSRVRELDETKFRIFYAHDLPCDPESDFLKNGGWNKFHKIVFVSNWQMQAYINYYGIPWSKCIVINNSIEDLPFYSNVDPTGKVRLIYTSTPHRGLSILYPVFDALQKKYEGIVDIELDVYSSFKLYGWEERDKQFTELFDLLKAHPKINYHGTASNQEVREALGKADIFAYPCIWPETSCLCLIEAMMSGLLCVHPNYGALPETSRGDTMMYQWHEDMNAHASIFYGALDQAIGIINEDGTRRRLLDVFQNTFRHHSWTSVYHDWTHLLSNIIAENPSKSLSKGVFSYGS